MTRRRPVVAAAVTVLLSGALALPALAGGSVLPSTATAVTGDYGFQGEGPGRLSDVDRRVGAVAPSRAQLEAAAALGADVRWNGYGTPVSVSRNAGHLSAAREGAAVDIARAFLREQSALVGLTAAQVDALEMLNDSPLYDAPDLKRLKAGLAATNTDVAHVVLFRQVFGAGADRVVAGHDGLAMVGVTKDGEVTWLSSTLTKDTRLTGAQELDALQAYAKAAADVGRSVDASALEVVTQKDASGFTTLRVPGVEDLQYTRLRALPTATDGVRRVWETVVLDNSHDDEHGHGPTAFISFVDAETGEVLFRQNRVDHFAGRGSQAVLPPSPRWEVFPANPAIVDPAVDGTKSAGDTRETWCWAPGEGCDLVVGNTASRTPWDVDARTGLSTFTTTGNNARTAPSLVSPLTPDAGAAYQPLALNRNYAFGFTNQWYEQACDPATLTSPTKNDLDAATANLFVGHNRIHDWSYYLGFTEKNYNLQTSNFGNDQQTRPGVVPGGGQNDPELGQSQAGQLSGPTFLGRDNANQITLQDGVPGITNQYLWQPLQAGFYAPCVDGAYDMSVIAHEYGHAIQNRMVGGPDGNLSGAQASSMGESWSDLTAIEYLNGYGYAGKNGEDPFAVGAYVTGDKEAGIRNYNMRTSPLNYSNIEVDGNGATSPHADGEIWSATNYVVRQALIEKYDAQFPSGDAVLQRRCADGERSADTCPGNRRWIQIVHDAFLLQPSATDMVMAKDAYLAADRLRFGGANQKTIADAFATRGLGKGAKTNGSADRNPTPSFESPFEESNARTAFQAVAADGGAAPQDVKVYVGRFEARSVPAATAPEGSSRAETTLAEGDYEFLVSAPGFALTRVSDSIEAGKTEVVTVKMRRNLASGGTVTGDGFTNPALLVDGTEATNVALLNSSIKGKGLTVALPTRSEVSEVQVSSALRPANANVAGDTGGQNRFSGLRSFSISTCDTATGADCSKPESFTTAGTFKDAFPAGRPRPTLPDLALRSFALDQAVNATHVRITVLDNQCTGGPLYTSAANPDNDPLNDPDCVNGRAPGVAAQGGNTSGSITQAGNVRIAELQVLAPSKK